MRSAERLLLLRRGVTTPALQGVVCGMSAGAFGQFWASPTDLIKVQLQLDGKLIAAGKPPRYTGTIDAFRSVAREVGVCDFLLLRLLFPRRLLPPTHKPTCCSAWPHR
jgi:hypothetical protein